MLGSRGPRCSAAPVRLLDARRLGLSANHRTNVRFAGAPASATPPLTRVELAFYHDARRLRQLPPLLDIGLDESRELLRRHRLRVGADSREVLAHALRRDSLHHRVVELRNDLARRLRR